MKWKFLLIQMMNSTTLLLRDFLYLVEFFSYPLFLLDQLVMLFYLHKVEISI